MYSKGRIANIQANVMQHNSLPMWQWEMGEKENSDGVSEDKCEESRVKLGNNSSGFGPFDREGAAPRRVSIVSTILSVFGTEKSFFSIKNYFEINQTCLAN